MDSFRLLLTPCVSFLNRNGGRRFFVGLDYYVGNIGVTALAFSVKGPGRLLKNWREVVLSSSAGLI